jgi:hypothetical protein
MWLIPVGIPSCRAVSIQMGLASEYSAPPPNTSQCEVIYCAIFSACQMSDSSSLLTLIRSGAMSRCAKGAANPFVGQVFVQLAYGPLPLRILGRVSKPIAFLNALHNPYAFEE